MILALASVGGAWAPEPALPNYANKLEERVAWLSFPVQAHFTRDSEYTPERARLAVSGFRRWEAATGGVVRVLVVERFEDADLEVRFDPETNNGSTTNSYARGAMLRAEMKIGVRRARQDDISCIAAHEFGHALGLNGHSDDKKDLMYPYRWSGKGCGISDRDLNTLATRYPEIRRNPTEPR